MRTEIKPARAASRCHDAGRLAARRARGGRRAADRAHVTDRVRRTRRRDAQARETAAGDADLAAPRAEVPFEPRGASGATSSLVALGHAAPDANGRSGGLGGGGPGILSPVSHCAQKLGTLHHWSASPGSANPPATAARRAGAPSHPFGLGTTPNPRTVEPSAGGFAPATAATPFDRHAADFRRDLAPIRSTGGLTFAEALARDSNGGARPIRTPQPTVARIQTAGTDNDG